MKKLSLIAVLLFAITFTGAAQIKVNIGVSTAINSTFVLDKGLTSDLGYTRVQDFEMAPFGVTFGTQFGKGFGLSLESILTNYKQIYEIQDKIQQVQQTDIANLDFDMQYLHLPVLMKFMSKGDSRARMNFNFGPQLSILTQGSETLNISPDAAGSIIAIPDLPEGASIDEYIPGATAIGDGTFQMPPSIPTEGYSIDLLKKNADDKIAAFRNQEFHLRGGMALDVDMSKNIFVSLAVQADYSFTDMRNGDLIDQLKGGASLSDVFGNRANLAVGAQITLNYMFGGTRSFLAMERKADENRRLLASR